MKYHLIATAIASITLASSSSAAVLVTLTQAPTSLPQLYVNAFTTTFVPDGSLVRIGSFFDVAGQAVTPDPNGTFLAYAASFREFARTTVGHTNVNGANSGRINRASISGGTDPLTSPAPDSDFTGKLLYIWVYEGANQDLTGTAPQGVFAQTTATFQDQATPFSFGMSNFTTAFGRTPEGQASIAAGRLNLAGIPEPTSVATFGLLAAFGFMRRRR